MASHLFRTKSADHLIAEAEAPERQMKRVLGPFALTCIGIGAIIGTGIFALAGTAAGGEQAHGGGPNLETPVLNFLQLSLTHVPIVLARPGTRPAPMLSFVVGRVPCPLAPLSSAH